MKEKKSAVLGGSHTEDGKGGDELRCADASLHTQDNTLEQDGQGLVSRFLLHGEGNAITTARLVQLTGCGSVRALRAQVEWERKAGALILACQRGYFLPDTGPAGTAELRRSYRRLYATGVGTLSSAKYLRRELKRREEEGAGG